MSKKNTGATLGVLVAVSVGATAYASAMNNLDKDTYAKTLLENKVSYVEPAYKTKLNTVKADYTKDVENTNIGESKKEVAVSESEKSATLYEAFNEANEVEAADNVEEDKVEEALEDKKEALEEKEETKEELEEEKVEDSESVEENVEENVDTDETVDTQVEEVQDEKALENEEEAPVEKTEAPVEDEKTEAPVEEASEAPVEEIKEEVVNTYAEKFVAVEYLNVRKEANKDSQVLTTINAGDKISGNIQGDWLKTDLGFVKLEFLQDSYPQTLVDELKAKRAQAEADRKAEEEKKAQEEANRKAEEEKKAKEEADRKAQEEKKAQEEANRRAQEEKKAQEAKKSQAVAYTGWVNTPGLNIRSSASTSGRILGNLTKGDKISGTLQNGWLKFTFNGQTGYVSGSYLVDYEVKKPEPVKQAAPKQQTQQKQANQQAQEAPKVASGNGQSAANIAQQFAGYPYVFGASNPSVGFDCSGLVHYAYSQIGINLSRNSAAQFSNGYAVDASNLVPGDLVFFSYGGGAIDHVGMITGYDGTFIHASTPGTGVVYGNVYSGHYQSVFRGARRIF